MKNFVGTISPRNWGKWILPFLLCACETREVDPANDSKAVFLSFTTNGQTLPTTINNKDNLVKFEVDRDVDVSKLTPSFEIPTGYTVYVNGSKQESGISEVDLSKAVSYEIRDENNRSTVWQVSAEPLACKILIDASHDGGVWWFPQYAATGFDQNKPHQGETFANLLRQKGFDVTELGRDKELTEEMFYGHFLIIRAGGFESYTAKELQVYTKLIERGTKLVFLTDHKKNDPIDELGNHLGLDFKGIAFGRVAKFTNHTITQNMTSMDYIAGSVLMNANQNPAIEVLGWLRQDDYADLNFNDVKDEDEPVGVPVMGILKYPKSHIFFIGDTNGIQQQPQPFIDNLILWMGKCFEF